MYQCTLYIASQYITSQQFPYKAFVPERLRGEALECVIGQGGLRIKYLVPYIRALFRHVASGSQRQASNACRR
jgi:hypothetical protein